MPKKKREITIEPVGYSAEGVTGSCNIVRFENTTVAIEMGGVQEGSTILANYNMNKRMMQRIKPAELSYIFVEHLHYDHIGNICSVYRNNKCNATIIAPQGSTSILKEMWLDSAKIMQKDCEYLSRKTGKAHEPLYGEEEISIALAHIVEYPSHEIIQLTDQLSFKYVPAGHIFLSQQLELFVNINNHISKILITSDLSNTITQDHRVFVEKFEPVSKATILIGESTYGLRSKRNTKKDLQKDLEKIKSVIIQYCIDNNNRVLFPTFSLDKTPIMLWYLYELFGQDKSFKVPIIVDSPLAIRLMKCYGDILTGEAKEKFDLLMAWKNIHLVTEYEESMFLMSDKSAKVIISSGGMLQSGRSVLWAKEIIPKSNDIICFCGYCSESSYGRKLKESKTHKTITIDGTVLKNRCQIISLMSFSSHAQHAELVNYYKTIQTDHIYLLHGDEQARIELKEDLQEELAKMCKSTKVSIVTKDMKIRL